MYCVYLVCSEIDGKKLHKIGFTRRTPEIRIKEFKTGNASNMSVVNRFNSKWGTKIESRLHNLFFQKKVNGEWFELDESDIEKFSEVCQLIDKNLNLISENNTYFLDKGEF
jgi:hypothetical protein